MNTENIRPSYLAWFFTISIAVFAGNMASYGAQAIIEIQAARKMAKELNTKTQRMKKQSEATRRAIEEKVAEQRKKQAEIRKQQNIEIVRMQNAKRLNQQTCTFWNQQVAKENTSSNRMYRDQACKRLRDMQ